MIIDEKLKLTVIENIFIFQTLQISRNFIQTFQIRRCFIQTQVRIT